MLENAGGEVSPSQEASYILLANNHLTNVGQLFPDRCERGKCKDRARLERQVRSQELPDSPQISPN